MAKISKAPSDGVFAVLPLRDIVVFPHMIVPLFVGREKSIKALEEVMGQEKQILLATQMNAADDDPEPDAIFDIGTLANVLQLLKLPDGTVKVLVEGASRAKIVSFTDRPDFHEARAAALEQRVAHAALQRLEAPAHRRLALSGKAGRAVERSRAGDREKDPDVAPFHAGLYKNA